uniref:Uncharacterized protein n=1 Tax=viral metagenome TaxID=1070528 RepID=A0A6C0BKE0_9ZZZZ
MARPLFTDGWNSFWHLAFGLIAVWYWPLIVFFALYQLHDPFEKNIVIDFSEFFVGYGLGYLIKYRTRL